MIGLVKIRLLLQICLHLTSKQTKNKMKIRRESYDNDFWGWYPAHSATVCTSWHPWQAQKMTSTSATARRKCWPHQNCPSEVSKCENRQSSRCPGGRPEQDSRLAIAQLVPHGMPDKVPKAQGRQLTMTSVTAWWKGPRQQTCTSKVSNRKNWQSSRWRGGHPGQVTRRALLQLVIHGIPDKLPKGQGGCLTLTSAIARRMWPL